MTDPGFLTEFLLVLVAATIVAVVFDRLRIPHILGFLLAGVILGPNGLKILANSEHFHHLAELGVVLLMLTIGLEFSVERLRGLKKIALWGGGMQLLISILISILFAWWMKWSVFQGILLGSVIALSSTAIVLKYLLDRGELDTQHGRMSLAILIFQDLAVPPLLIFISGMGLPAESLSETLIYAFLKAGGLIFGLFIVARYIFPTLLKQVALSRSREIFFLASIVICLGISWISGKLGLSLAIGAFFAGFIFANSEYGSQFTGEIIPFRHIFVSIFFVSIGLIFNLNFALENFGTVMLLVGLVLFINFGIVSVLIMGMGYSPRIAMAAGILLSQIGEFSFILIETARVKGGIDYHIYQLLLSTAFITMLLSPLLFGLIQPLSNLLEKMPIFGLPPTEKWRSGNEHSTNLENHVIVCGYGAAGFDLATSLKAEKVPFVVLEMNPRLVQKARKQNVNIIYGDAANVEVLRCAGISKAKAVVISFSDPIGMGQIVRIVQTLNPDVYLVVRTRFESEISRLYELGADRVILEEWEASAQINRVLLKHLDVPAEKLEAHLERIRMRHEIISENLILKRSSETP